ncbi:hypothetical protein [Enterococcus sp. N249-2]
MNEKIQNMITALAKECLKENITLSLAAFDENGKASLAQFGSNSRIEVAIARQIEQWEKNVRMCDCRACKKRGAAFEEEDQEFNSHSNDFTNFKEKLEAFFRGDLT